MAQAEVQKVSIKAERERREWSRAQLATLAGLGYTTIVYAERYGALSPRTAEHIARVFDCPPEVLAP